MQRIMLKSKIHRATLTETELDYVGSITIDVALLEQADILPGEQVHVLNINNGARFITYTIAAERDGGAIVLNGAAARLGRVGDPLIILSYCHVDDRDEVRHIPRAVFVDRRNRVAEVRDAVPE
ncbi:MAG: aspartate 1-decarboxylase [Planctomycetota bacterium]|nr:aspartate 1-decarboxylase [Planctomycetota bacterium]